MTALLLGLGLASCAHADALQADMHALIAMAEGYRDISNAAIPLMNQLAALSRNYGPKADLAAAAERRSDPRRRLAALLSDLGRLKTDYMRLRPGILDRNASGAVSRAVIEPGSPDPGLDRFGRAETALSSSAHLHYDITMSLELEETAFRAMEAAARNRSWTIKALVLGSTAAVILAAGLAAVLGKRPRRRKPPPPTPGPPPPSYEIIT